MTGQLQCNWPCHFGHAAFRPGGHRDAPHGYRTGRL